MSSPSPSMPLVSRCPKCSPEGVNNIAKFTFFFIVENERRVSSIHDQRICWSSLLPSRFPVHFVHSEKIEISSSSSLCLLQVLGMGCAHCLLIYMQVFVYTLCTMFAKRRKGNFCCMLRMILIITDTDVMMRCCFIVLRLLLLPTTTYGHRDLFYNHSFMMRLFLLSLCSVVLKETFHFSCSR